MKIKGIAYPHEYLWRASSRSLTMAETNNREQYYLLMQSLLTAYLAFEAFINFLGECLDPDAWRNEKLSSISDHTMESKVRSKGLLRGCLTLSSRKVKDHTRSSKKWEDSELS